MRKFSLSFTACALAVATPATAETVLPVGSFSNYGACVSRLAWFANSQRREDISGWGLIRNYAGYDLYCSKYGDKWYIVYADEG